MEIKNNAKNEFNNYQQEIYIFDEFMNSLVGDRLINIGYWEFIIYPSSYVKKRITNLDDLESVIKTSIIRLDQAYTPITNNSIINRSDNYLYSYAYSESNIEVFASFLSGLIIWNSVLWEDMKGGRTIELNRPVLTIKSTVEQISVLYHFAKKYFESSGIKNDVHIKISLKNTNNRMLDGHIYSRPTPEFYIYNMAEINILKKNKLIDLYNSHQKIAIKTIKDLFNAFGWYQEFEIDPLINTIIRNNRYL